MIVTDPSIRGLFASKIDRRIEEVIKVDQTDEEIIRDEIQEYVVTDSIRGHFTGILERYRETPNKPHEGIAIWVSGFFGSGKSSFAKILGLAIENREVLGDPASALFAPRADDPKVEVLLAAINQQIPTHTVIFDVSTDRGIKSGNQTLTEIMYRLFLHSLGYARDLDLAELEIALESEGRLDDFKASYRHLFDKDWDTEKGKVVFALSQASQVMHDLHPATYPHADSWVKATKDKADITPGRLAERCTELMKRRKPGMSLMFVIDEVGQFVARDIQKMLDLQAVVQSLGRVGRGKHWIVVTSQEKLNELVGGLDDRRVELARLMDRFPQELQVHLENSDISEVTSRRVLAKNAAAQKRLRELFEIHRGRLTDQTRISADIKLPELTAERFVDLYPLLPYHIDLIIQIVSGLRTQGGASRHVGGANRTIIKLAQQLLINPSVNLAEQEVGRLARLDQVYDLVEGNIGSEVRAKIATIPVDVDHPLAHSVAKAICLLQFAKSVHRTAENIAAVLLPAVDADSQLAQVKEALEALEAAHKVRRGDDGYRIPTPAEDDWERQRTDLMARPGDAVRLQAEVLAGFWQPVPTFTFLDTKTFRVGLALNGRDVVEGNMTIHVHLAEAGKLFGDLAAELRVRSQQEQKSIFWGVAIDEAVDRETVELHRSKEMLSRKEREAKTGDETALIGEEKLRLRRHQDELKRLLKNACLAGAVFFRGNDRSPSDPASDVAKTAATLVGQALPDVFDRFSEAAARVQKKDLDVLMTSENLYGLTQVFTSLKLLRDEKGKPVFRTEDGPLAEVLARIEGRASYGETATGKWLADEFAREPFGWDFDVMKLLVLSLLRAGKIEATSKGQPLDSALSVEAKDTFNNNNLFRVATFRPKVGLEFEHIVKAAEAFREVFGKEVNELEQGHVAAAIHEATAEREADVQTACTQLVSHQLPGAAVLQSALEQMRAIQRSTEPNAIQSFNASFKSLKEAIKRAAELESALTEPRVMDLSRARTALQTAWPFLKSEPDLDGTLRTRSGELEDLLKRETFFRELPVIEQHARALEDEYKRRHQAAVQTRRTVYQKAHDTLCARPEWEQLDQEQQARLATPLDDCLDNGENILVPQLRADVDACQPRLDTAMAEMLRLLEGERVVQLDPRVFFTGGVESEEQLDAALAGLREECARLIGAGKRVLVQ